MDRLDKLVTPEYRAAALKRIDGYIAARARRAHSAAMAAIKARRRNAEKSTNHTNVDTKQRTLIAPQPTLAFLHVCVQRQSDDDHDANLSFVPNTKPGGYPSGLLSFLCR